MKTLLPVVFLAAIFIFPRMGAAAPPFIVTESAIPIDQNRYRADVSLQFQEFSLGRRSNGLFPEVTYGLIHNLEVKATLPYLFAKQNARHHDQIGDLNLQAKVLFLKGRDASPISIAGAVDLKIPSASPNRTTGTTGEADTRLAVMASKMILPYKVHLNLSHTYVGNLPREERFDRRRYSIGVEYIPAQPSLSFMGELFGSADVGGPSANEQWSLAGGASYPLRPDIGVDGAIAFGLSNRAPDFIIHLRTSYFF